MATAGGYDEQPPPDLNYHVPYQRDSSSSVLRSAGEDLLRMLHQGGNPTPGTSTIATPLIIDGQCSSPPQPTPAPPFSTPRSLAAEQERILRNYLAIGVSDSPSFSSSPQLQMVPPPPPPPPPPGAPVTPPRVADSIAATSSSTVLDAVQEGDIKRSKKKRGKSRGSRGKGGKPQDQQSGQSNSGDDCAHVVQGASKPGAKSARTKTSPTDDECVLSSSSGRGNSEKNRGARSQAQGKGTQRDESARESGKGGKQGTKSKKGPRAGAPPQARQSFALSQFQRSPDPSNIPTPSLQHFSLNPEVSEGGRQLETSSAGWQGDGVASSSDGVLAPQELLMHTPPPPPKEFRVGSGERSSAQRIEDDIKRILRLS